MNYREPIRWGVKSVGGLLANLALLTVWVDYVGIRPEFAIGINWVLISIAGYVVTDRWVFRDTESPVGWLTNIKQYLGMQSVMASGKVVNYLVYVVLLRVVDYRIAWAAGAVLVFLWTFVGNKKWWQQQLSA